MLRHNRVISMAASSNMKDVFGRFCTGVQAFEALVKKQGHEFQHSDRLGYIASCPCNLGTGMRASVHVKLPRVSQQANFDAMLETMRLQKRGTG